MEKRSPPSLPSRVRPIALVTLVILICPSPIGIGTAGYISPAGFVPPLALLPVLIGAGKDDVPRSRRHGERRSKGHFMEGIVGEGDRSWLGLVKGVSSAHRPAPCVHLAADHHPARAGLVFPPEAEFVESMLPFRNGDDLPKG